MKKFYKDLAMHTMAGLTTVAIMKGAEFAYDKIKLWYWYIKYSAEIEAKKNSNVDDDSEEESDDTFEFDVEEFEESESSEDSDQESDKEIHDLTVEEYLDELMGILHDSYNNQPSEFTRKILSNFYKVSENGSFFLTGFEAANASIYFNERYDKDDIEAMLDIIDNQMNDFIKAFSIYAGYDAVRENALFILFNSRIEDAVKEMKEKKNNEEK